MTRRIRPGAVVVIAVCAWMFAAALAADNGLSYVWDLPPGFPQPKVPADNPMTADKVELGRHLFYDTRLSVDGTFACANCHQQEHAFADSKPRGVGVTGEVHPRGSMSLANVAYSPVLTWANPTVRRLETQALVPMFGEDPIELGLSGKEQLLIRRLQGESRYTRLFRAAFPGGRSVHARQHHASDCVIRAHVDLRPLAVRPVSVRCRARCDFRVRKARRDPVFLGTDRVFPLPRWIQFHRDGRLRG